MNNRLVIAAAGSGKTTYLVKKALEINSSEQVLITTYTEVNESEIRKKILKEKKYIPANITVQTWFSFLLQHGVRPYQGALNDILFKNDIKGMLLVNKASGIKFVGKYGPVPFKENTEFIKHYFTKDWKIYSDKLPKFVVKCNKATKGKVIERITKIYNYIYIDEIQDLAGYDLEIIKLLFKTNSTILLVGDPRQVTYLTHHERKHKRYNNGKIKDFIKNEVGKTIKCDIDTTTLSVSHRNNRKICDFSAKLYPYLPKISPCNCESCRNDKVEHEGVFLIKKKDIEDYISKYKPKILRWSKSTKIENGEVFNMGESKGMTFDRVLIYPTRDMVKWIENNKYNLKNETRAKFYVAITRAKYSVAIILNYIKDKEYDGLEKYYGFASPIVVGRIKLD